MSTNIRGRPRLFASLKAFPLLFTLLLFSLSCAWLSPTRLFAFRRKPEWAKVTLTPGVALQQRFQPLSHTGEGATAIAIQDQKAYLGTGPYLQVFDLSDPAGPELVGQSAALPAAIRRIALPEDRTPAAYLLIEGDGLQIIDLSDPAHPAQTGNLALPSQPGGIAVQGKVAFLTTLHAAPPYGDPQALRSLRAIDISDPAHPQQVGLLKMAQSAAALAIQDNYLYYPDQIDIPQIADGKQAALHVIDISDPAHLVEVAQTDTTPLCPNATSIAIQDNTLYLGADTGDTLVSLCIFDISDPLHPRRLSAWDDAPPVFDLAVSGHRVFVACGGYLAAIDVSDPRTPWLEDLIAAPGKTMGIAVHNSLIHVTDTEYGLGVLKYR